MKKLILIVVSFITISFSTHATVPSNHPDLAEYFSVRYQRLTHNAAVYDIDFKEVQSILFDGQGNVSVKYGPETLPDHESKANWGKNFYWIFFRNGTWIIVTSHSDPQGKWTLYKNFLKTHPQFLSIP